VTLENSSFFDIPYADPLSLESYCERSVAICQKIKQDCSSCSPITMTRKNGLDSPKQRRLLRRARYDRKIKDQAEKMGSSL
jgi:hypothetical protein